MKELIAKAIGFWQKTRRELGTFGTLFFILFACGLVYLYIAFGFWMFKEDAPEPITAEDNKSAEEKNLERAREENRLLQAIILDKQEEERRAVEKYRQHK